MAETWRVVLASGEVLSVECLYIGTVALAKVYGLRAEGVAVSGQGDNFIDAILDLARDGALRIVEILAPGEPTRAELAAQLATATASVQQLRADVELATAHGDEESARAYSMEDELAVLRAQQAPLVACVDALRAAARDAGWRDADATGESLVAWVRRGAMRECLAIEAPKVRALRAAVNALCNVRTLRATCAEGETWRAHVHDKDWTDARANALAVLNATGGGS